jgi:hypothetical protein
MPALLLVACNLMFNLIFSFDFNKCSFIYFSRDKWNIIWILYLSYTWQPSLSKNGETLQPEELCRWARSISITLFWYCFYDFTSSTHADRKNNNFKTVSCIGWSIQPSLFYFMDCNYDKLNIKKNTQHMGWPRPTQIVWPVEGVDQIHEDGTSFGVTWKTGDSSCSHLFYREMGPWSSGRGLEADIQNDFEPTHSIHGLSPTYLVTVGSGGG